MARTFDPNTEKRCMKILRYIIEHKLAHDGLSPTLREIGGEFGIGSTSLVSYYLDVLVRTGKIRYIGKNTARSIEVIGGQWRMN